MPKIDGPFLLPLLMLVFLSMGQCDQQSAQYSDLTEPLFSLQKKYKSIGTGTGQLNEDGIFPLPGSSVCSKGH